MSTCPTCNAHGDAHCVTKSGAKAKKPHANRPGDMPNVALEVDFKDVSPELVEALMPGAMQQIAPGFERETDKQRYHRLKAEKRAAYEAKKAQRRALAGVR